MKLGKLLIDKGMVSIDQLEEGLQSQIMFGGRLGLNLMELGFLTDEQLATVLGEQLQCQVCKPEQIQNLPHEVVHILSKEQVEQYNTIPIRKLDKNLWVGMLNPDDRSALDEIAFATNYRIHPLIVPELQFYRAIKNYYQIECNHRIQKLIFKIDHPDMEMDGYDATTLSTDFDKSRVDEGFDVQSFSEELNETLSEEVRSPASNFNPIQVPNLNSQDFENSDNLNEPDSMFPIQDISEVLTEARSKEDIFQAIQSPFMEFFDRFMIFVNKGDVMTGINFYGEPWDPDQTDSMTIPLRVPSIFREVTKAKSSYFGTFPKDHNNKKISDLFGMNSQNMVFLLCPVPLVEKVGILYYADGCNDIEGVAQRLQKFNSLGIKAGLALQVLVLKQKILQL